MLTKISTSRNTLLLFASTLLTIAFLAVEAGAQAVVPPAVTLSTVADGTLSIPGGTGMFESFNPGLAGFPPSPVVSNGSIAFWGGGSGGQQGIYTIIWQSQAAKVADLNTAIPGGIGDFLGFSPQPNISR